MNFQELQRRLISDLHGRIRRGELSERGLARLAGVSQPHIHNVLKGKRSFSAEISDIILFTLKIDLLDLVAPEELARHQSRMTSPSVYPDKENEEKEQGFGAIGEPGGIATGPPAAAGRKHR